MHKGRQLPKLWNRFTNLIARGNCDDSADERSRVGWANVVAGGDGGSGDRRVSLLKALSTAAARMPYETATVSGHKSNIIFGGSRAMKSASPSSSSSPSS